VRIRSCGFKAALKAEERKKAEKKIPKLKKSAKQRGTNGNRHGERTVF